MDVFVHKFVTVSPHRISGNVCSEIHFSGTNITIPFLEEEENSSLESKYAINIKEIKNEIDTVKKTSKAIIVKNGEPCLQRMALKSLATHVKKQRQLFVLETYGTRPKIIKYLIDNRLLDLVVLKLYFPLSEVWMKKLNSGKLVSNYKEMIDDINETIDLLRKSQVKVIAKTIIVPGLLERKADIGRIVRSVKDLMNCVVELLPYKPGKRGKVFGRSKKSDEELMNELKEYIAETYPNVHLKVMG